MPLMPKTTVGAKVALTCIVKDDSEAMEFERMLDSIMPHMSGLYVAVTGVSGQHDKIHSIVKNFNGISISTSPETHPSIYSKINDKWVFSNFAEARNVSFDMVPDGYDYLCWADSDDIISGADEIVKVATRAKELKLDIVYFVYWYAVKTNEQGEVVEVIVDQIRERLLKPGAFKWISRLHEVCVPKESGFKPQNSFYEFDPKKKQLCVWVHTADYTAGSAAHTKIVVRNKEILEIQAEEERYSDPRTLFYLGKTHFDIDTPESLKKAKELLTKYRTMSGWDAERANSCEYLGLIAAKEGNFRDCVRIYLEAISEYPMNHLAYLRLSEAYLNLGALNFAKHWLEVAVKMDKPTASETVGSPFEIKLLAAQVSYRVALAENKLPEMEEWARIRKGLMGGKDDGLLEEVLEAKALNTAATSTFNLSKWLKDHGHADKVATLIDMLPPDIINQPYMSMIYKSILPPRKWEKNEIAYFASFGGAHFEQWGPKSLETGIGGSETAVLELSKEWTKQGYKVTVFCDCGDEEGVHDGVTFLPYYKMNWHDEFNVLILWRQPELLDQEIKARKLFFDLHDVASQTDWPKSRMDKVDKVFFKSTFHRNNLPKLPDNKAMIISNGVRL